MNHSIALTRGIRTRTRHREWHRLTLAQVPQEAHNSNWHVLPHCPVAHTVAAHRKLVRKAKKQLRQAITGDYLTDLPKLSIPPREGIRVVELAMELRGKTPRHLSAIICSLNALFCLSKLAHARCLGRPPSALSFGQVANAISALLNPSIVNNNSELNLTIPNGFAKVKALYRVTE